MVVLLPRDARGFGLWALDGSSIHRLHAPRVHAVRQAQAVTPLNTPAAHSRSSMLGNRLGGLHNY